MLDFFLKMDFINLKAQYRTYREEIEREIGDVLDSHRFILGAKGRALEEALAGFVGIPFAVGVGSGTDALILSLMAMDVGPGDEIITSPFTFIASGEAVALTGARPVFADIDRETFNLDPRDIEERITRNTRGILAVDLFGLPADYDSINTLAEEYGLFVIEDGAQSFGALSGNRRAPSLARIGTTSFFPAKPLGCFGEGGMVFTATEDVAKSVELLRNHGQGEKYSHHIIGKNSRLDEIQAAVLLAKFGHFEGELSTRQEKARYYRDMLKGPLRFQKIPDGYISSYAQFSFLIEGRDRLAEFLSEREIPTAIHYPVPLHLQRSFSYLGYVKGDFPVSEEVSRQVISIPFSPFITEEEQERVVEGIAAFIGSSS